MLERAQYVYCELYLLTTPFFGKDKNKRVQSALVRLGFLGQVVLGPKRQRQEMDGKHALCMLVKANTIPNGNQSCILDLRLGKKLTPHSLDYRGAAMDTFYLKLTPEAIMH